MHWETKKFVWLTLLNIHFIVMMWNPTLDISEVCLLSAT